MSENQSAPPPSAAPAGRGNLILIIVAAVVVAVLCTGMFLLYEKLSHMTAPAPAAAVGADGKPVEGGEAGKEGAKTGEPHAVPGAGPTVRLADFVVHLRNPETDRYARISFELEVATDKDKDVLTLHQAQIRDAFLAYLSDRTVEELRGSSGLSLIKSSLLKIASDLAPEAHLRAIFITDFVVQ
jgi:flagellar FliL protein